MQNSSCGNPPNKKRVLRYLLGAKTASISEICQNLQISQPTASQHVYALEAEGLLSEVGTQESTGGRRAKLYACNADAFVAGGINITRKMIEFVIVNLAGEIIAQQKLVYPYDDTDAYREMLSGVFYGMMDRERINHKKLLGVGVSLPAIISRSQIVEDTAFEMSIPANIRALMKQKLHTGVDLFNDANSGGYAEFWNYKGAENLFYLNISGSIGGAAMVNGHSLLGDDMRSAEIGHTTIVQNGRKCYCKRRGCMNAYCSTHVLQETSDGKLDLFFEQLDNGDENARHRWNEYLDYLALAINNIYMLFDCRVIIGGPIERYLHDHLEELHERLIERDSFNRNRTYLSLSRYHSVSSAVGAALVFVDKYTYDANKFYL